MTHQPLNSHPEPDIIASDERSAADFEREARRAPPSFLVELRDFLLQNAKWWLTPIVIVLLLLGLLLVLSSSVVAPFIYPLF